jgi:hypothetical protein
MRSRHALSMAIGSSLPAELHMMVLEVLTAENADLILYEHGPSSQDDETNNDDSSQTLIGHSIERLWQMHHYLQALLTTATLVEAIHAWFRFNRFYPDGSDILPSLLQSLHVPFLERTTFAE